MALTVTLTRDWRMNPGDRMATRATLAFDSEYPTGGESLTPEMLGLGEIDFISIGNKDGYIFEYDYANEKILVFGSAGFTPEGTNDAPAFTGDPLAAHSHVLHFQTGAAANAVTAQANQLRTAAAAFDVAGVANSAGEGGVVDVTAGTPAGTVAAPVFTGTPVAAGALVEVAALTDLATLTGVPIYAIGRP